ncbi:MAG: trypsin-like peptidase domain-containing protein [Phycisphaerales bacterium]
MRKIVAVGPALVVLLTMALVAWFGPALIRQMVFVQTEARVVLARQALIEDDILERIDAATRRIAEAVGPSVVHIDVTLPLGDDDDTRFRTGSSGAGWVFDAEGHIVTNAHVVGTAESVQVEFSNGRTTTGRIVEADEFTDIAVVKVDPGPGLIPVQRNPMSEVRVGDRVYAFGSPFNFKFSMTEGIVSGLGRNPRTSSSSGGFTNYIQTDAAVNPGNSGGPLVNVRGELVGMNVAIATGQQFARNDRQGQSAGISFAIPLGVIESVVDQIVGTGEVRRGFLGISSGGFATSSRRIFDTDGAFVGKGVFVESVTEGQAAERAGIQRGDIITRIDGNEIREWHHLTSVVTTARPGSRIPIELWRDGRRVELTVDLAEFPDVVLQQNAIRPALLRNGIGFDGRSTSDGQRLVIVEWVDSRRGPGEAGFRSRDRVLSVNGQPIDGLGSFYIALGEADLLLGRRVVVEVQRGDDTLSLPLRIEP